MSRPDWGALQQEYIAEYTRSGVSPVAWCEARGLNYATARRYIKKPPKNAQTEMCKTAQQSAQKKSAQTAQKRNGKSQKKKPVSDACLNEGDAEEFSFCPDEFGISDQQAKFAMLVAQGKNLIEAYRLAGSVRLTLYGFSNKMALDLVDSVVNRALEEERFGVTNIPVVQDAKSGQVEINALAKKKIVDFDVNYYQSTAREISRQLIEKVICKYEVK